MQLHVPGLAYVSSGGEIDGCGFAGFGGWCLGHKWATGKPMDWACNHDAHAMHLHSLNHPETRHFPEDVWRLRLRQEMGPGPYRWLHVSPDCTHHSDARGALPRSAEMRGLANVLVEWVREVRPRIASLENVVKFMRWGPLDADGQPIPEREGECFREFVEQLRELGGVVEWRVLVAADYGAPTTRERLYMVIRFDGQPIVWPEPTHGEGRAPWRTIGDCMDWSKPAGSIFRARMPAINSQRRQAVGFVRYVLNAAESYVVPNGAAWVVKHYTGVIGHGMGQPLGAITTRDHHAVGFASLVKFYKSGGQWQGCDEPLHTVTTRARFGVVQAQVGDDIAAAVRVARWVLRFVPGAPVRWLSIAGRLRPVCVVMSKGVAHLVVDIATRMLTPRELARAMGFPDSYVLEGSQAQQIERIGNAVCPHVAKAIVAANITAAKRGAA